MSQSKGKSSDAGAPASVSKAVISRLGLYLRELQHQLRAGTETINSTQLGNLLGITDAQVRKDLTYFGQFGYPGIGYRCDELVREIKKILGTNRCWPVAIIGAGNLGRALIGYRGFEQQGFRVVAALDADPSKVGGSIEGIEVQHIDNLPQVVQAAGIRLAIIAVPADAAQTVADRLCEAGIEGILNFAPVTLAIAKGTGIVGVDLAIELEQLSFAVAGGAERT